MAEVIISPRAISDIESIREFIANRDSERYADGVVRRIYATMDLVAQFPMGGRVVPEVGVSSIREVIEGNHRIVYRVFRRERAEIVTVYHSARRFPHGSMKKGKS